MKTLSTRHPPRAFTLVELLAVIVIIGILAGILIPVTLRVRASARSAQCAGNLRQLGIVFQIFANENRGRMVFNMNDPKGGTYWYVTVRREAGLPNYATGTFPLAPFLCPASYSKQATHFTRSAHQAHQGGGTPPGAPFYPERVSAPSRLICALDGEIPGNDGIGYGSTPRDLASQNNDRISRRHAGRANILYYDWHVASVDPSTLPGAPGIPYANGSGRPPWESK
ncbi:MAG: prepilin-type N-terminal cleavage/methylation domain-containing protein [Opitutaceae bacterium]|nr:prepilin-type N-terminal cleavage/methylation domain-containing protein [Opitutaceae bacterium]